MSQKELDLKTDGKERVDTYEFEPIKGYPMLNWKGKRPFRSTQYYPAQLKENHGQPVDDWMNRIYWGDNLQVMGHLLKEFRGKIDLIYIDPPFDSKADYKKKIKLKGQKIPNDYNGFEEKQYADIWTNDEYLQFIFERIVLLKELLSPDGSIYIHCDSHKYHYLRCIMDEIFGPENFLNHIIWSYKRWPSITSAWQSMHDDILFYSRSCKSNARTFNVEYEEASESYTKRFGGKTQILDMETGTRKITIDEPTKGMPCRDVWELSILAGFKSERTGYPTQKPETLLERIIRASSKPGDIVFDPFMGSGTTQAVAMRLGRRFIGADINLGSIQTTSKRLLGIAKELEQDLPDSEIEYHTGFSVYNVNNYDVFRNPVQAKELLLQALEIQQLPSGTIWDGEKDGRLVKIMPVNRIATRADLNEIITGLDYKKLTKKAEENPTKPVEHITLVCMGHEPNLAADLQKEVGENIKLDIEVVDILRDKSNLEFKRDSEAEISAKKGWLAIKAFYPMNLLQKLSIMKENVDDWRELVESVMIDFNYDGSVFEPQLVDVPEKNKLVVGKYDIPKDAGTIRIKITDLLSESLEQEVANG